MFEVTAYVGLSVMHVIIIHPYTTFVFVGFPIPKIWLIFGHWVKWPGDLDLRPFNLLMGSRVTRGLPSCQFSA